MATKKIQLKNSGGDLLMPRTTAENVSFDTSESPVGEGDVQSAIDAEYEGLRRVSVETTGKNVDGTTDQVFEDQIHDVRGWAVLKSGSRIGGNNTGTAGTGFHIYIFPSAPGDVWKVVGAVGSGKFEAFYKGDVTYAGCTAANCLWSASLASGTWTAPAETTKFCVVTNTANLNVTKVSKLVDGQAVSMLDKAGMKIDDWSYGYINTSALAVGDVMPKWESSSAIRCKRLKVTAGNALMLDVQASYPPVVFTDEDTVIVEKVSTLAANGVYIAPVDGYAYIMTTKSVENYVYNTPMGAIAEGASSGKTAIALANQTSSLLEDYFKQLYDDIKGNGTVGTYFLTTGENPVWATVSGYRQGWLPITNKGFLVVKTNVNYPLEVCMFTSNSTSGVSQAPTNLATGWTEVLELPAGSVTIIPIPANAHYLGWKMMGTEIASATNRPQFILDASPTNVTDEDLIMYAFNGKFDKANIDSRCTDYCALCNTAGDTENFIFFTDPHIMGGNQSWTSSNKRTFNVYMSRLLHYFNSTPTDFLINGGDWLNQGETYATAYFKLGYIDGTMRKLFGDKYFPAFGNHDTNYLKGGLDAPQSVTYQGAANIWFRPYGKSYYTFKGNKTRFFVFDTWKWAGDGMPPMIDFWYDQIEWFGRLLEQNTDEHIILVAHAYYVSAVTAATVVRHTLTYNTARMADAFNKRSSFSYNGKSYDFSAVQQGKVHCIIAGHTHEDGVLTTDPIPVMMTTNMQDGGTPTFDLCVLDYEAMKLRTVRVGTGEDRELDLAH
ncbi:MAG: metallophosphoesterase [Bacteroidaceae bacterium]|nr:metallophosphoesterase [Bacteroidaceae bacterium]